MQSLAAIQAKLELIFLNNAWAGLGDTAGLQPSAAAGNLYIGLHTAYVDPSGDQTTNEAAYTGYARVPVARDSSEWTVSAPSVTNINQVTFPQNTGGTETETYYSVGTAPTGTGQVLYSGPITTLILDFSAETTGNISVPGSSFSVDDRVAFFPLWSDFPFPTGITAGQLYYVKTVTGDVITISATSGGSLITILSAGGGACATVTPFVIANGDTPALASGQISIFEN